MDKNRVLGLIETLRSFSEEEREFFAELLMHDPVETLKKEGKWEHKCSVYSLDSIMVSWDQKCDPVVVVCGECESLQVNLDALGVFSMKRIFDYIWGEISGRK